MRRIRLRLRAIKNHFRLSSTQAIAIVFAVLILLGACLLNTPAASRTGQSCGFLSALFTATSATCVTGLVLFDTWTQFTTFGQGVILALIELGGLGFMSAAAAVIFLLRRKVGLRQRMLMAQALSLNEIEGVVRLQRLVIFGSLFVQLLGALILFLRFLPSYGFEQAAWWGLFHAVSAFCNAGFDVWGSIAPGASATVFNDDPVVLFTLMTLIVVGGLGFFVWEEVVRVRRFSKFSVYTRLVLITTAVLLAVGMMAICLLEWNNPNTLGPMTTPQKLMNALFQSATVRTAGFAGVDQSALTEGGKGISMLLMIIGGSSGSTAGGLKTVTLVVLLLFIWTQARGRSTVCVFRRTIPSEKVLNAVTIVVIMVMLSMFGGIFLSATSPVGFTDALFESVSALATVGLTTGITGSLSIASRILIIVYMYFGRVGVLTISLGFLMGDKVEERYRYANTNLLIG